MPMTSASPASQYLTINDLTIHYKEYSNAGHPLLLLHGGSANLETWEAFLAPLTPHFRVIALDSRGHGRTNNPAPSMTYRMMADDVVAFIEALHLTKPYIFGYSDGGQMALELGIHHPQTAGALVLGGTQYQFSESYYNFLEGMGFNRNGTIDLAAFEVNSPHWIEYLQTAHAQPQGPDYWKTLMPQLAELWCANPHYTEAQLQGIAAPTLIIMGDRDSIPITEAAQLYQTIPTSELAILPNADHGSIWGDLFINIVRDFLLRHPIPTA